MKDFSSNFKVGARSSVYRQVPFLPPVPHGNERSAKAYVLGPVKLSVKSIVSDFKVDLVGHKQLY